MSDTFTVWMLTGKEVSAAPTAVYGHGPGGLFSHAALSKPVVGAAIEGWRKRKRAGRHKEAGTGGRMADYFLTSDLDALLGGGTTVKETAPADTQPVMEGGALTMPSTPSGDEFVDWAFFPRSKAWDESKHPRGGKGTPAGGKFAPKGGGDPDNTQNAQGAAAMNYGNQPRTPKENADMDTDDRNRQALQDRNDGKITQTEFEKITGMGSGGFAKSDEPDGVYSGKSGAFGPSLAEQMRKSQPAKNLSQQTDADAAKRGAGRGKTDFEKPSAQDDISKYKDTVSAGLASGKWTRENAVASYQDWLNKSHEMLLAGQNEKSDQTFKMAQAVLEAVQAHDNSHPQKGDGIDHTDEADFRVDANGKKHYL